MSLQSSRDQNHQGKAALENQKAKVKRISFYASLPPIQSAISLDGMGDGARVKIDVPATDVEAILNLQRYFTGKCFRVTIEDDTSQTSEIMQLSRLSESDLESLLS